MLNVLAGASGTGKSTMVFYHAAQPLLVLTPDVGRAKAVRASFGAEDRIRIARVSNLAKLAKAIDTHAVNHDGIVLVEDFRALCNAQLIAYTGGASGKQKPGSVDRAVWYALSRHIIGVLAKLSQTTCILATQTGRRANSQLTGPAAGSAASSELVIEHASSVVPLIRPLTDRVWVQDPPKTAGKGGKGGKGGKRSKGGKRGGLGSVEPSHGLTLEALQAEATRQGWTPQKQWPVVADLTNRVTFAKHGSGLSGLFPAYGPLLFEDLLVDVHEDEVIEAVHRIRADKLHVRDSGFHRVRLKMQAQVLDWSDYRPADDI